MNVEITKQVLSLEKQLPFDVRKYLKSIVFQRFCYREGVSQRSLIMMGDVERNQILAALEREYLLQLCVWLEEHHSNLHLASLVKHVWISLPLTEEEAPESQNLQVA